MDNLKRISVSIPEEQKDFLETIIHEDAGKNLSEAVQWCIDSCMRIEKLYGIDACYIAFHDIRLPENDPAKPATDSVKVGAGIDYKHPFERSQANISTLTDDLLRVTQEAEDYRKALYAVQRGAYGPRYGDVCLGDGTCPGILRAMIWEDVGMK